MQLRWLRRGAKVTSAERGSVWSMGDGYLGCLGHGDWARRVALEMIHEAHLPQSWSVSAGWAHSASISADGEVMLWGRMRVSGVVIPSSLIILGSAASQAGPSVFRVAPGKSLRRSVL